MSLLDAKRKELHGATVSWTVKGKGGKVAKRRAIVAKVDLRNGALVADCLELPLKKDIWWEGVSISRLKIEKPGSVRARDRAREVIQKINKTRRENTELFNATRLEILRRHGLFDDDAGHARDGTAIEIRVRDKEADGGLRWVPGTLHGYTASWRCRVRFTWTAAGKFDYCSPLHCRLAGSENPCSKGEWEEVKAEVKAILKRPVSRDPEPDEPRELEGNEFLDAIRGEIE